MSEIDRQRIAAVRTLEALGYCFRDGRWNSPPHVQPRAEIWTEVDAIHQLVVQRADTLIGCTDGPILSKRLAPLVPAMHFVPVTVRSIDRPRRRVFQRIFGHPIEWM